MSATAQSFEESIDYRSNPLKDLLVFEERIQHNISSLQRIRTQALVRIILAALASWLLLFSRKFFKHKWLELMCLVAAALFILLTLFFVIHTLKSRRLSLLSRYRQQCLRLLRLYNLDLRVGLDHSHVLDKSDKSIINNGGSGPFVTVKRRIAAKVYDLLDAYRVEYWRRRKTSGSAGNGSNKRKKN